MCTLLVLHIAGSSVNMFVFKCRLSCMYLNSDLEICLVFVIVFPEGAGID